LQGRQAIVIKGIALPCILLAIALYQDCLRNPVKKQSSHLERIAVLSQEKKLEKLTGASKNNTARTKGDDIMTEKLLKTKGN
jgi:hypothetical protein